MKKTTYIWGILVLLILILLIFFGSKGTPGGHNVISDTITVTTFTNNGVANENALVRVPFLTALSASQVSVGLDSNIDGTVSPDEIVVAEVPATTRKDWDSGFYFVAPEGLPDVTKGEVTVDGQIIPVSVKHETQELGDSIDLSNVTLPEESMKGLGGVPLAYADEVTEVTYDNAPDISQRPGECAPTAAANSLIDLVGRNSGAGLGDPFDLIDDLKEHMHWTRENGVLPDDFVAGKNSWAKDHNLPITTKKVGDANGVKTPEEIQKALENGDAVELRIKFADRNLHAVGGHMVTVTGIHTNGEQTYIDISDPYTKNNGTETVEIRSNQLTNYGPWKGITVLSWGFVESWTGTQTDTSARTSVETPANENSFGNEPAMQSSKPTLELSFDHVKPGEYSEVYAVVTGLTPGDEVTARLTGGGHNGTPQVVDADENGVAHFTYRITQYGTYTVDASGPGFSTSDKIEVK